MVADKVYERKSFSREEWNDAVAACTAPLLNDGRGNVVGMGLNSGEADGSTSAEPSIPKLLLNYFVCMGFEESSVRMAREMGYVKSNKDAQEFNDLYRIRERAHISKLIKTGRVSEAMEEIKSTFGIEVLECGAAGPSNGGIGGTCVSGHVGGEDGKDDLHFKLLLLDLIEKIRKHDRDTAGNQGDDDEFVLELIKYSQEKLALKAASNRTYMAELELVMTLLLFPKGGDSKVKLPKSLKNLYSLSLRSNIAELVNRKLLRCLHSQVATHASQIAKFPDLIGFSNGIAGKPFSHYNEILMVRPKKDVGQHLTTDSLAELRDSDDGRLRSTATSANDDWSWTIDMIKEQQEDGQVKSAATSMDKASSNDDFDLSEARLVQVMKLWAWCENQLHNNDIGVPRVHSSM
ncbi:hypothetical protein HG537_0A03210 [Torulaspora globosa]|uniref:CTLH domain-containing protein n=1 Tax=Torulaspora globosa TaxID=48254 RepID=A0A7H9HJK2_9SACH|nr:hypothetical protein HG537_0A03210 [Torulaspora sp. CBS 2947]